MDKVNAETRSRIMASVKPTRNRSTEWRVRSALVRGGVTGWVLGTESEHPGRPEFIFSRQRIAVFVDGCFWHGCPFCYRPPRTRQRFWAEKVRRNKARDARVSRALRRDGWTVLRLRECRIPGGLVRLGQLLGRKLY
jgi:DNA mismatch endonuclease (patch repair protein)